MKYMFTKFNKILTGSVNLVNRVINCLIMNAEAIRFINKLNITCNHQYSVYRVAWFCDYDMIRYDCYLRYIVYCIYMNLQKDSEMQSLFNNFKCAFESRGDHSGMSDVLESLLTCVVLEVTDDIENSKNELSLFEKVIMYEKVLNQMIILFIDIIGDYRYTHLRSDQRYFVVDLAERRFHLFIELVPGERPIVSVRQTN